MAVPNVQGDQIFPFLRKPSIVNWHFAFKVGFVIFLVHAVFVHILKINRVTVKRAVGG